MTHILIIGKKSFIGSNLKNYLSNDFNLDIFSYEEVIRKNKTFIERVQPVYESIQKVKKRLNKECLIGFVGAPWTILVYMLNKQSPKKNLFYLVGQDLQTKAVLL